MNKGPELGYADRKNPDAGRPRQEYIFLIEKVFFRIIYQDNPIISNILIFILITSTTQCNTSLFGPHM